MKTRYNLLIAAALLGGAALAASADAPGPEFDTKKQRWGFMEATGKWKVKPQFTAVSKLPSGGYLVEKDGNKGYFNGAFERVASTDYDTLSVGHTGYVMVRKDGKWGLVAPNGKTAIKPRYATMAMAPTGMLCVSEKGFAGIVDNAGNTTLPLNSYTSIEPFSTEFLLFRRGEETGLLDQGGHERIKGGRYSSFTADGDEFITVVSYGKTGILNGHGEEIIAPLHDNVTRWLDRYFMAETIGKKGVYSLEGKPLIPAQFDSIVPVGEAQKRFMLTFGDKKGLSGIDQMILPCEFSSIEVLADGRLKAARQGLTNLYTAQGKPAFSREEPVGDGLRAMSNSSDLFTIVDADFNIVVPERRGRIAEASPLILIADTGDQPLLLTPKGKKLLEAVIPAYEMASEGQELSVFFNHQPAESPNDGRFSVFDRSGILVEDLSLMEGWQLANDSIAGDSCLKAAMARLMPKIENLYAGSAAASGKSATIEKIWMRDGVIRAGAKGIEIHTKFAVEGAHFDKCSLDIYFLDSDGNPLRDADGSFADADGFVVAQTSFMPEQESATFADMMVFMPYSQLHIDSTERTDGWVVVVVDCEGEVLATSEYINFTVAATKGAGKTPKFRKGPAINLPPKKLRGRK